MNGISDDRTGVLPFAALAIALCHAGGILADTQTSSATATIDADAIAADGSSGRPAVYNARSGILTITGNSGANVFVVGRDAGGNILVNGGTVAIKGGQPTVSNTVRIDIFGRGGNDQLALDESNGAMPPARISGEAGDDSLIGGSGADELNGGGGSDTIAGRRGADVVNGGDDDDIVAWDPGDGSDVVDGGAGRDQLVFNGSNAQENLDLSADGTRLRLFRDVGNVVIDGGGLEQVTCSLRGGADAVMINDLTGTTIDAIIVDLAGSATPGTGDGTNDTVLIDGGAAADTVGISDTPDGMVVAGLQATVTVRAGDPVVDQLVVNGQDGADNVDASAVPTGRLSLVLIGGAANDVVIGGDGDDALYGGPGDDTLIGGGGGDSFVWNPGDGSDVVEGQSGLDALLFRGSNAAESVSLAANGGRLSLRRNVGNITIDANDVESVTYAAIGGADGVVVNDLSATDVVSVNLDLANPSGTGTGDGQADSITVNGTTGDDVALVVDDSAAVQVIGLAAAVNIAGSDAAMDQLVVQGLAGDDVIDASGLADGLILLTEDGGDGNDVLIGSDGPDILLGGPGDDVLIGGAGIDVLDGGSGDNVVVQ